MPVLNYPHIFLRDWKKYVQQAEEELFAEVTRKEVMVSRPIGEGSFIKRREKRFQCRLGRQKQGRPSKENNKLWLSPIKFMRARSSFG